jgi:hypothetical protein
VGHQGTTWMQMRPGGAGQEVGHVTWVRLGLGGRLCLSFGIHPYIPRKPIFPEGREIFVNQSAATITIYISGG